MRARPGDDNWYIAQIYTIAVESGKATSILKTSMQSRTPVLVARREAGGFHWRADERRGIDRRGHLYGLSFRRRARDLTPAVRRRPSGCAGCHRTNSVYGECGRRGGVAMLDPSGMEVKTLWTEESALTIR